MTKPQQKLLNILESIHGSGAFCVQGKGKFVPPGMSIDGFGPLPLPLTESVAESLLSHANKAKFGKGSQTIEDTSVRSTWEFDAEKVSFNNPEWDGFISETTSHVLEGLGMKDRQVRAEFYKMLIYQEGDFFLPHRDSEKEKGMFASMVLCLPCTYTGGALHVSFEGQVEVVDFSDLQYHYSIPYVAFYADCEHEIKKVESGFRLCLTYNLIQEDQESHLPSPALGEKVEALSRVLKDLKKEFDTEPFTYVLSHLYTPSNFGWKALKNHDASRANALLQASRQAGYLCMPALLTVEIEGALDDDSIDDYYGYYGADVDVEGSSMGEVFSHGLDIEYLDEFEMGELGFVDPEGDHIIGHEGLGTGDPHEKQAEGYTGNAGLTMDYWYHYGVMFFWPKDKHKQLMDTRELETDLTWLPYYLNNWEEERLSGSNFARSMLKSLAKDSSEMNRKKAKYANVILTALLKLDDVAFSEKFGMDLICKYLLSSSPEPSLAILKAYGAEALELAVGKSKSKEASEILNLLKLLTAMNSDKDKTLQQAARMQLGLLGKELMRELLPEPRSRWIDNSMNKDQYRQAIVEQLLAFAEVNLAESLQDNLYKLITKYDSRKYQYSILLPILRKRLYTSKLAKDLKDLLIHDLESRVKKKPKPPSDFRRNMPPGKGMKASILRAFMASLDQPVYDYRAKKAERMQLERAIEDLELDLDYQTIKSGSPHILRLTKNTNSYKKALEHWTEDTVLLKELQGD